MVSFETVDPVYTLLSKITPDTNAFGRSSELVQQWDLIYLVCAVRVFVDVRGTTQYL